MKLRAMWWLVGFMIGMPHGGLAGQGHFPKSFDLKTVTSPTASIPSNGISHIALEDSILWIGTDKGLAGSFDFGRSWQSFRNNSAFANDGIFAIATHGDTIWASTGYDKAISDGTVQTGSGYAYSTDRGSSWHHLPQTIDQRGDSLITYGINDSLRILPVVVPEQNVTFDIALTQGTVWIASWASGLRKSTDNGLTWQRIILPTDSRNHVSNTDTLWVYAPTDTARQHKIFDRLDPRNNNNFLAFSVYSADNDTIWCGTAGGVNKSTDGGSSWVKFDHQNESSPILGNWVIAIAAQHWGANHRIWTTNWRTNDPDEDYGVSYTDDGGGTWKNLLKGIKAYSFAFKDSITYIATDNGVYRTDDGGQTFALTATITDPFSRQVILQSGVFAVGVLHDTVYVGTGDGFASTVDNSSNQFGSSWNVFRTYQQVGTSASTYAYPNPFAPDQEQVRIHYGSSSIQNGSREVSVDIFDFGMNRVRTLIHQATRSTNREYDEFWDGTTDDGKIVANGVYFYRIRIDNNDAEFGKILAIQ